MNPEYGIDYDKIVITRQNEARAEDFADLNRLRESKNISPGMRSEILYLEKILYWELVNKETYATEQQRKSQYLEALGGGKIRKIG